MRGCHKQFIDQEINKVGWVQLQNQYDNLNFLPGDYPRVQFVEVAQISGIDTTTEP